mgnify:CR=1 FL=1
MLRVRLRRVGSTDFVETSARVNTGYTSSEPTLPEIYVPVSLALRLGFDIRKARRDMYATMGEAVSVLILGDVEVKVVAPDRETPWVKAIATTLPGGRPYVIISDELLHFLNVSVIDTAGLGVWAFRDELNKLRQGVPLELWPER